MPRQPRIEYPGAYYHVMSRGDRRERIFEDDEDRRTFLKVLEETCQRCGWQVVSWVLMGNHFHLQIHTPEPNLVTGMKWMLGTYTIRFNRRHRLSGHLFQGRYKAIPIEDGDYLLRVSDYIHLNPVRAGLVDWEEKGDVLKGYVWSSYPEIAGYGKPGLCSKLKGRLLGWCGLEAGAHRAYRRRMSHLAVQERKDRGKGWEELRRGWCLGEENFGEKLLDRVKDKLQGRQRTSLSGEAVRQHDEAEAEWLVQEALKRLGWTEGVLEQTRKAAAEKEVVAWRLRRKTTVGASWIARRLRMGHATSVTNAMTRMRTPSPDHRKLIKILKFED
jgi:putative transposase